MIGPALQFCNLQIIFPILLFNLYKKNVRHMPRPKRYHIPGSSYHVMLRGNDGQDIFFSDRDRCKMCLLLQEGIERYGHRIHAFCFMNNHIHLLIQVGAVPLSKIMQNIAFRYSQNINLRNDRVGHLFQGRFKAILIEENVYFKRLIRYIHRNPVRANLIKDPKDYFWSSHNAYLGQNEIAWLTIDYALSTFDNIKEIARERYISYILKEENKEELLELRKKFKDGHVLGDDEFLNEVRNNKKYSKENRITITIDSILKIVGQVYNLPEEMIIAAGKSRKASLARATTALFAKELAGISIEQIARFLNRDGSTISSLLSRIHKKYLDCPQTQEHLDNIKDKIIQIAELQV